MRTRLGIGYFPALLCLGLAALAAGADDYWTCGVNTPSVALDGGPMSADIHSAGFLSIDDGFGFGIDESESVLADHKVLRQSDNLLIGQDFFVSNGGFIPTRGVRL